MARKQERSDVHTEIVLESSAGKRQSRISDMSAGGCFIESMTSFREGEPVAFELHTTSGATLRFSGTVAYVLEGFGFGMTFTDLTPEHIAFLAGVLPKADPLDPAEDENLLGL